MNSSSQQAIPSSFRDHSGYVFNHEGEYYRAVNHVYTSHYHHLMRSGLYEKLTQKGLLITHTETEQSSANQEPAFILKPTQITTISYVWEWSFSMLRDAALCTLENALIALDVGMILKDANTFNIQFLKGSPVMIDTLSFELYNEGDNWIAYRQFCEQFLAPLLLMKYCNASLIKLTQAYPNGIPLHVCKAMLPFKSRFNLNVYLHIFLQSKLSSSTAGIREKDTQKTFSKGKLLTLLNGLKSFIQSLKLEKDKTVWDNYYDETILSQHYLEEKKNVVKSYLHMIPFSHLLDLGANDGQFSRLYMNTDKQITALDEDRNCIEKLYTDCCREKINNIIPLVCDLTAPSPSIGWNLEERPSIFQRIHADVTLALALIHHLAIANNIPLEKIISFLASLSPYLIIEFVPKEDPKVKQLLANRTDIFDQYTLEHFRSVIGSCFEILNEDKIESTDRIIFLLKRKA